MDVREGLVRLIADSSLSDEAIAARLGGAVSDSTIYRVRKGDSDPKLSLALGLAQAFGYEVRILSPDEAMLLDMCEDLNLDRREALRRLAAGGVRPAPEAEGPPGASPGHVARPLDPDTGAPLASPRVRKGRRA